jgi:hypothetical protein
LMVGSTMKLGSFSSIDVGVPSKLPILVRGYHLVRMSGPLPAASRFRARKAHKSKHLTPSCRSPCAALEQLAEWGFLAEPSGRPSGCRNRDQMKSHRVFVERFPSPICVGLRVHSESSRAAPGSSPFHSATRRGSCSIVGARPLQALQIREDRRGFSASRGAEAPG